MNFKTTLTAMCLDGVMASGAHAENKALFLGTMAVPGTTVEKESHLQGAQCRPRRAFCQTLART
ncbi:hypothetical protein [Phaeobacter gallaeciensis]|uniref:Uncharacterized protein n=1 Tax=Phaeobacter gallaeciensis TaxID=60890 RepID=A0ABD4XF70_9RHOB|nr:hypothetical protein [Phaeobacter gallaeciensis]MDE4142128.1 hypothetical protein [Phaeobacter gallaeciensis]MDE4146558.1 hypothetical protein [Phaeobacter gallaeciensis]MDE4150631.1 hypothetical protein [Phaeobacter gallaeciensis]MDE4154810.1 hypothetical protein [Phaeobacter gallaeciensis]MDE4159300.1 hypothetical protein [Phaeobacter gallaeciensis]